MSQPVPVLDPITVTEEEKTMGENEQLSATYELLHADAASPVVISLPHSGTWIPADMRKHLLPTAVLANSD